MNPTITHSPLVAFIFVAIFGVALHDTQADKASVAIATPSHFTNYAASEVSKSNEHVHVERVSIAGQGSQRANPKAQPRDDTRRYITNKKVVEHSGDGNSIWPSA